MSAEGKIRTISFAGAGNVAGHLASALFRAGFEIRTILSRNPDKALSLASSVGAKPGVSPSDLDMDTDLLILALPDQVIPVFSSELKKTFNFTGIVAHTSGSQSMGAISMHHSRSGVFYPLQSFTRHTNPDIGIVPFCIEGSSPEIQALLGEVALKISVDVRFIDSAQRAAIHLAAVFASNFSNYMYAVADCLLARSNVKPDILLPLIRETATRLKGGDAADLQTGPAVRRDWSTIDMHLSMLRKNPELKELYKSVSEHITKLKESGKAC